MDGNLSFLFDIGGNICYMSVRELVKLFVSFGLIKFISYEMLVHDRISKEVLIAVGYQYE